MWKDQQVVKGPGIQERVLRQPSGNAGTIMLPNQLYVRSFRETTILSVAFERVREVSPQSEA